MGTDRTFTISLVKSEDLLSGIICWFAGTASFFGCEMAMSIPLQGVKEFRGTEWAAVMRASTNGSQFRVGLAGSEVVRPTLCGPTLGKR